MFAPSTKDPDSFPVVFDVIHFATDVPVASDELVDHVLQWPLSDRYDTRTGPGVRPEDSRHDRPLARLLELASSNRA